MRRCRACEDPVNSKYHNGYCRECWEELTKGKVPAVVGPTGQSHASHLTPRQAAKLGKTSGG